jgi:hypothetical protein
MSDKKSRATVLLRRFWTALVESLANGGAMGFVVPPLVSLDEAKSIGTPAPDARRI